MNVQQLQAAVSSLCPTATFPGSYTMIVDATGNATIGLWNNTVGSQPTAAQLTAALATEQLGAAMKAQIALLEAAYMTARYGSTVTIATVSSPSVSLIFPTDTATQTNVMGYLTAYDSTNWPAGNAPLQGASGAIQMLAYTDMKTLAKAIADASIVAWKHLMTQIGAVQAATTIAAIQAVIW